MNDASKNNKFDNNEVTTQEEYVKWIDDCLSEENFLKQIEKKITYYACRLKKDEESLKDYALKILKIIKKDFLDRHPYNDQFKMEEIESQLPNPVCAAQTVFALVESYFVKRMQDVSQEFDHAFNLALDWYLVSNWLKDKINQMIEDLKSDGKIATSFHCSQKEFGGSRLDASRILEEIEKAYLKDYPFTQYTIGEIVSIVNDMMSDALYYCRLHYAIWTKMNYYKEKKFLDEHSILTKYDEDVYNIILRLTFVNLWKSRSNPMKKNGILYKNLSIPQLIKSVDTTMLNLAREIIKIINEQLDTVPLSQGDNGDNNSDTNPWNNIPGRESTPEENVSTKEQKEQDEKFARQFVQQYWKIIKSLSKNQQKVVILRYIRYPQLKVKEICEKVKIKESDFNKLMNDAFENILSAFQRSANFNEVWNHIHNGESVHDARDKKEYIAKLKVYLKDRYRFFKEIFDHESEEFRGQFGDDCFNDNSNDND